MKKTKNYCFHFLLIVFIFISCEKNSIEKKQNCLIPLKVGNKWIYQEIKEYSKRIDTITLSVTSKIEINGYEGFIFDDGYDSDIHFLCKNNKEGDFICIGGYSNVDTLIVNSVGFKYNVKKGDSWGHNSAILDFESETFEKRTFEIKCIAHDTLIEIANKKYKLYEKSPNKGKDIFRHFISDNIGEIKQEHYELGKLFACRELIDYKLN